MAEIVKASVFAVKEETTDGELIAPTAGAEFIPLREGFSQEASFETLESDELVNSIGAAEPAQGKETPSGVHPIYLKHSEVEGQEPEYGIMIESLMGGKTVNAVEFSTTGTSGAGSLAARAFLEMGSDEEDNFVFGQGVLIKDSINGFSIRNVQNVDSVGNQLDLNFNLDTAPATLTDLGKAVFYNPTSTGHPSYSSWLYAGNGGAIQAIAGSKTSSMSMEFTAGQFATAEFNYEGSVSFFDPFIITSTNKFVDFTDDGGTFAAELDERSYKTPLELADAITTKMNAVSSSGVHTVTYNSDDGKYTFAYDGSVLSLLWDTGGNTANTIGTTIGFDVSADDTGSTSYTGDNAIDLTATPTPSFDDASNIVVKNAELFLGTFDQNVCVNASTVSITIDRPNADVDSICEESAIEEKLAESRSVTMTATITLNRFDAEKFDKFSNNETIEIMMNAGPKDGSGNWIPGKTVNIYMPTAKYTQHNLAGDAFITIELEAQGFNTTSNKDVYINFL